MPRPRAPVPRRPFPARAAAAAAAASVLHCASRALGWRGQRASAASGGRQAGAKWLLAPPTSSPSGGRGGRPARRGAELGAQRAWCTCPPTTLHNPAPHPAARTGVAGKCSSLPASRRSPQRRDGRHRENADPRKEKRTGEVRDTTCMVAAAGIRPQCLQRAALLLTSHQGTMPCVLGKSIIPDTDPTMCQVVTVIKDLGVHHLLSDAIKKSCLGKNLSKGGGPVNVFICVSILQYRCVCAPCVYSTVGSQKRVLGSWDWSYRSVVCVLGIQPMSSGGTASIVNL